MRPAKITLTLEGEHGTVVVLHVPTPDKFEVYVGIDGLTYVEFAGQTVKPPRTAVEKIRISASKKVRKHSAGTSWAAAYAQTPEKSQQFYRIIFRVLEKYGPLTDDEIREKVIAAGIPHSDSGLRARRKELVVAGWVQATTLKRPSKNGHPSTVWEAVPERI